MLLYCREQVGMRWKLECTPGVKLALVFDYIDVRFELVRLHPGYISLSPAIHADDSNVDHSTLVP